VIEHIITEVEGWLAEGELRMLNRYAASVAAPLRIVEIGIYRGRSTCALGHDLQPGVTLYAIDPEQGENVSIWKANVQRFVPLWREVQFINQPSLSVAATWKRRDIGLIFFDGDHPTIDLDLAAWLPFVVEGGLAAFHDSDHLLTAQTIDGCAQLVEVEACDITRVMRKVIE